MLTSQDNEYMRRALHLARRGLGLVEPNPMVGCVLVRKRRVVGEGYHHRFGGPHAEVEALRRAGEAARGATAYVNLEPCCHYGKTPPCTDALIRAGISRVVVAIRDPFPQVDGGGLRALRRVGVRVHLGLGAEEARQLNAAFLTRLAKGRPYTILKWAQSLDGKIATRTGDSKWISDPEARTWVHRTRARVDAILVGVGTVLADDPELIARDVPVKRIAARVILDSRLRIPPKAKLVVTARSARTIIFTTKAGLDANDSKGRSLRRVGVELIACPAWRGRVSLAHVVRWMGRAEFTNLLVEGGGEVIGAFLDQRLADEAMIFVSPRLIGGDGAVSAVRGTGALTLKGAARFSRLSMRRVGCDLLYRARLGPGV